MAGKPGMKGGGGARPGAGRKPKQAVLIDSKALLTSSPVQFLMALMNDCGADIKVRADAAKALLSAELRAAESKGKKEQRQDAAKKVGTGRFAPAAPPRLVASNK